jgi:hypothetical protein
MASAGIGLYLEKVRAGKLSKPAQCWVCGKGQSLSWHGTYHRGLITLAQTLTIPVKRLYCRLCRHTFAFLPSFVVKFHRYAGDLIRSALRSLKTRTYDAVAEEIANGFAQPRKPDIATLTLYFWRRKFA